MAEDKAIVREIHWRHVFPWLAIFRTFGVALDAKKMALGGLGAVVMASGWWLLATLFENFAPANPQVQSVAVEVKQWPWSASQWPAHRVSSHPGLSELIAESELVLTISDREKLRASVRERRGFEIVDELLRDPLQTLWQLGTNWRFVLQPVDQLVRPFRAIFVERTTFVGAVFALACGLWGAWVWAFFGGAITRIAAVQFAREEKISLREALQFSASKYISYGGAPLIPLVALAFFIVLCLLGGLLGWGIPWFGPLFAGTLWVLPLVAGFIMALIVIGWAIGWPLMYSTISVEGSDSFDALSRSFAYVFQRPWHYLLYILLVTIFGSFCGFFVLLFADLLIHMARWAVAWGGGERLDSLLGQLFYYAPEASGWRPDRPIDQPTGATGLAAYAAAIWLYGMFLLIIGYVYSYFWSAATVIYYLLRRDVDNTELQEVYLEGETDEALPGEGSLPSSPVVAPGGSAPSSE